MQEVLKRYTSEVCETTSAGDLHYTQTLSAKAIRDKVNQLAGGAVDSTLVAKDDTIRNAIETLNAYYEETDKECLICMVREQGGYAQALINPEKVYEKKTGNKHTATKYFMKGKGLLAGEVILMYNIVRYTSRITKIGRAHV